MTTFTSRFAGDIRQILPRIEQLYKHFHQHPELPMHETQTAAEVASILRGLGLEVTEQVGNTGVVGVLRNGDGPVVMVRADMDALPVKEATGLPYASSVTAQNDQGDTVPVMHACGHDMHTSWLLGACMLLTAARDAWRGTLLAVFQPAEETAKGAQAMIDDGMLTRFPKPDVVLGQHGFPFAAGNVGYRAGQIMASGDSLTVRFFGQGSHGSQPQNSIDPIVMAAAAVMRLQTIISREIHPQSPSVVTIGEFYAGTAENIIPAEASIKLNIRTTDEAVREHILAAVKRICIAEAQASNAPREPEFIEINSFPLTVNDPAATGKVVEAFRGWFGEQVHEVSPIAASDDFSRFARGWQVPYVYWFVGIADPAAYARAVEEGKLSSIPMPHSPFYAPVVDPALRVGLEALLCALGVWLEQP